MKRRASAEAPRTPIPLNASDEPTRWWHTIDEPIPPVFALKSIDGNQTDLAEWICPVFGLTIDRRNLHGLARDGFLWIVKSPRRRHCHVYFRSLDLEKFAEANAKRLAALTPQSVNAQ